MATTATFKDRTAAWVEANPLRRWRKRHGLTATEAAAMLGVAYSSFQPWEKGGYPPSDESMAKLAEGMGIRPATLARKWAAWLDDRPQYGAA